MSPQAITVQTTINASTQTVWNCWTQPDHIVRWAFASSDWETPMAQNDLRVGGKFLTRMAAKDKSAQFDFTGTYTTVRSHELIEYTIEDGRQVRVEFKTVEQGTVVTETFEPETLNPPAMQHAGWQAILENFRKHTEVCAFR